MVISEAGIQADGQVWVRIKGEAGDTVLVAPTLLALQDQLGQLKAVRELIGKEI